LIEVLRERPSAERKFLRWKTYENQRCGALGDFAGHTIHVDVGRESWRYDLKSLCRKTYAIVCPPLQLYLMYHYTKRYHR